MTLNALLHHSDAGRSSSAKVALISRVPLFATLPRAELEILASSLDHVTYPAGTILFHEDDLGERFYIVLEGRIAIVKALGSAKPLAAL